MTTTLGGQVKPLVGVDPTKVTVNQWLEMYREARGTTKETMSSVRSNLKKIVPDYMDRPLVDLVEAFKGKKNPLLAAMEAARKKDLVNIKILQEKEGMRVNKETLEKAGLGDRKTLYSSLNNLQAQLKMSLEEFDKTYGFGNKQSKYSNVDVDKDWKLNAGVPKPVGTIKKIYTYNFVESLIGHRLHSMMEYVSKNREYANTFRMADFQQNTGMRVKELLNMSPYDLRSPHVDIPGSDIPGFFLDQDFTKMSTDIDIPAHPRIYYIFRQQMEVLEKAGLLNEGRPYLPYLWVNPDPDVVYNYKNTLDVAAAKTANPNVKIINTDDPKLKGQSGFTLITSQDLNHLNKNSPVNIRGAGIVENTKYPVDNPNRWSSTLTEARDVRHLLTKLHWLLKIPMAESDAMLSRADAGSMSATYGGQGLAKASGMHSREEMINYKRTTDKILSFLKPLLKGDLAADEVIADNVDLIKVALGEAEVPTVKPIPIRTEDGRLIKIAPVFYANQKYYTLNKQGSKIKGFNVHTPNESIKIDFPEIVDAKDFDEFTLDNIWSKEGTGETISESASSTDTSASGMSEEEKKKLKHDKLYGPGKLKMVAPFLLTKNLLDTGEVTEEDKKDMGNLALNLVKDEFIEWGTRAGLVAAGVASFPAAVGGLTIPAIFGSTTAYAPEYSEEQARSDSFPSEDQQYFQEEQQYGPDEWGDEAVYKHIEAEKRRKENPYNPAFSFLSM